MSRLMGLNDFRLLPMKRTGAGLLLCAMVLSVANVAVSQSGPAAIIREHPQRLARCARPSHESRRRRQQQ